MTTAAAETFEEVKAFVFSLVHAYRRRFKLDYEESVSAAFYGFCQAYDSYTPEVGAFTTWVGVKVKRRLQDVLRRKIDDQNRKTYTGFSDEFMEAIQKDEPEFEFDADEWLARLSDDGRLVASLVLTKPTDIRLFLKQLGADTPGNWRQAIREYLTEIDWSPERVKASFQEIKEKL